jgi:hypothetical protein
MAGPLTTLLGALAGHEVAIISNPPMLVFDVTGSTLPVPPPDLVRIRAGSLAGHEGRWLGSAGPRHFGGVAPLEAGRIRLADGSTVAIPLGDLERFA